MTDHELCLAAAKAAGYTVESYDAMSTKPKALFYVAAKPNAARPYLNLSAVISTERHMGSRTITHWMPLPAPPAGGSHHE